MHTLFGYCIKKCTVVKFKCACQRIDKYIESNHFEFYDFLLKHLYATPNKSINVN